MSEKKAVAKSSRTRGNRADRDLVAMIDRSLNAMQQRMSAIADNEASAKFGVIVADAMAIACSVACALWPAGAKVGIEAEFAVGDRLVRVGVYAEGAEPYAVKVLADTSSILYRAFRIWVEAWAERGNGENQEDWFGGPGPRTAVRLVSEPLPPELRPRE